MKRIKLKMYFPTIRLSSTFDKVWSSPSNCCSSNIYHSLNPCFNYWGHFPIPVAKDLICLGLNFQSWILWLKLAWFQGTDWKSACIIDSQHANIFPLVPALLTKSCWGAIHGINLTQICRIEEFKRAPEDCNMLVLIRGKVIVETLERCEMIYSNLK